MPTRRITWDPVTRDTGGTTVPSGTSMRFRYELQRRTRAAADGTPTAWTDVVSNLEGTTHDDDAMLPGTAADAQYRARVMAGMGISAGAYGESNWLDLDAPTCQVNPASDSVVVASGRSAQIVFTPSAEGGSGSGYVFGVPAGAVEDDPTNNPGRYVLTVNRPADDPASTSVTVTVTVTDGAGTMGTCSHVVTVTWPGTMPPDPCSTCQASIMVSEPNPAAGAISATVTARAVLTGCGSGCCTTPTGTGVLTAQTVTPASPNYSFSSRVICGTYDETVTASGTVTFPPAPCAGVTVAVSVTATDESGFVGETLSTTVTRSASGGTGPYSYSVTGDTYRRTTAGTVTRTVVVVATDANGCRGTGTANWDATFTTRPVTDPCDTCQGYISVTEPTPGETDSSATVTAVAIVAGCGSGCAACTGTGALTSQTVTRTNPSYSFAREVICGTYSETLRASGRITFPAEPDPCADATALTVDLTANNASADAGGTADSGASWMGSGGVRPYSQISLTGDTYACPASGSGSTSNRTARVTIEDHCGTRASDTDAWTATCRGHPCNGCTGSINVTEPSPGVCDNTATVTATAVLAGCGAGCCTTPTGTGALTAQTVQRGSNNRGSYSFSARIICGTYDRTITESGTVTFPARAAAPTCTVTATDESGDTGDTLATTVAVTVSNGQGTVRQTITGDSYRSTRAGVFPRTVNVALVDACGQTGSCSANWDAVFTDPCPDPPPAPTCTAVARRRTAPGGCDDEVEYDVIITPAARGGGTITVERADGTVISQETDDQGDETGRYVDLQSVMRSSPSKNVTYRVTEDVPGQSGCPSSSLTGICIAPLRATFPARPGLSCSITADATVEAEAGTTVALLYRVGSTGGCGTITGTGSFQTSFDGTGASPGTSDTVTVTGTVSDGVHSPATCTHTFTINWTSSGGGNGNGNGN